MLSRFALFDSNFPCSNFTLLARHLYLPQSEQHESTFCACVFLYLASLRQRFCRILFCWPRCLRGTISDETRCRFTGALARTRARPYVRAREGQYTMGRRTVSYVLSVRTFSDNYRPKLIAVLPVGPCACFYTFRKSA